jgi:ATP-binding cassette, subfamily B, multidrug efflux pump
VIAEEGTHAELMAGSGWYKEQYIRQQAQAAAEEEVLS